MSEKSETTMPMSPEDMEIARLRKALGRIAGLPRAPGANGGEAQKIAREALAR